MKAHGELDSSGSRTEEPSRTEVRQEPSHRPIVRQHQGCELSDALVSGALRQAAQQRFANAAALPGFKYRDRDLRRVAAFALPDVASDTDALIAGRIDGQQRLMIVVVDFGQIAKLGRG